MARHLFIFFGALLLARCSSVTVQNRFDGCEKITVGPGTEDIALQQTGKGARILVSSHERREWKTPGDIYAFDLQTRTVKKMPRENEPAGLFFAPHGIDIFDSGREKFLYVINHGKEINDADQSVLIYRIGTDSLVFVSRVRDELINSPNDLAITETGSFYVANDHKSRGSKWELLWGLKKSSLVYCTVNNADASAAAHCKVVADQIGMANSPLVRQDRVFLTATRENAVYAFRRHADGSLSDKVLLAEVPGPDNLAWHDQSLLTASHTSNWKFFRHASSASNNSPSYIVAINPADRQVTSLYFNDGSGISAASGALVYAGRLYIAQVFEDFIFECRPVK